MQELHTHTHACVDTHTHTHTHTHTSMNTTTMIGLIDRLIQVYIYLSMCVCVCIERCAQLIHVSSMTTATCGWLCWVVVPMIKTSWLPVDCNALSTVLTRSSTMYVAKTHTPIRLPSLHRKRQSQMLNVSKEQLRRNNVPALCRCRRGSKSRICPLPIATGV